MELFDKILNLVFSEYGLIGAMFVTLFWWELKTSRERESESRSREEKLSQSNLLLLQSNKELLDSNKIVLDTNQALCGEISSKLDIVLYKIENK